MSEQRENLRKQEEEIQTLSSMYEDSWQTVGEKARKFSVQVKSESSETTIGIQVEMPPDYPSRSPPLYTLNAPWLRGRQRRALETSLQEIFDDNKGERIVHMWIDKIREFLEFQSRESSHVDGAHAAQTDKHSNVQHEDRDNNHQDAAQTAQHEDRDNNHQDYPCPEIHHGEPVTDRKSTFVGHLAHVTHPSQVEPVLEKLKQDRKIAKAEHNVYAYRIRQRENSTLTDCNDDGENTAGSWLLRLLERTDANDVMVVVTRWHGGIQLGADRFKHYKDQANAVLHQCGFTRE